MNEVKMKKAYSLALEAIEHVDRAIGKPLDGASLGNVVNGLASAMQSVSIVRDQAPKELLQELATVCMMTFEIIRDFQEKGGTIIFQDPKEEP